MNFPKLAPALLLFALSACTTMTSVQVDEDTLSRQLETGDRIVVQTKDGQVVDMHYVLVRNGEIRGSRFDDGLQPVRIPVDAVETVRTRKSKPDDGSSSLTKSGRTLDLLILGTELIRLVQ